MSKATLISPREALLVDFMATFVRLSLAKRVVHKRDSPQNRQILRNAYTAFDPLLDMANDMHLFEETL